MAKRVYAVDEREVDLDIHAAEKDRPLHVHKLADHRVWQRHFCVAELQQAKHVPSRVALDNLHQAA